MARKYSLNNVSAIQIASGAWKVTFNKRVYGKQWKKEKTFKGGPREVQKFMEDFRGMWEQEIAMQSGNCAFNLKESNISDLLDYYTKARGLNDKRNHYNAFQFRKYECEVRVLKNRCGKVKIYPGDSRPYWTKFHNDFRLIFNSWKYERKQTHMVNGKKSPVGKKISNSTIYGRIQFLKKIFQLLEDDDLIPKNPMNHKIYKEVKKNPPRIGNFGNNDDPSALLEAIAKHRPHIFFVTWYALLVPSRKRELTELKKDCIDLEKKRLIIPAHLSKNKTKIFKEIPECMMEYFSTIPEESEYVFYKKRGGTKQRPKVEYLPLGEFRRSWDSCCKLVGFERNVFHDTRHFSATQMEKTGRTIPEIMRNAGWKRDTMMNTYRTLDTEGDNTVIDISEAKNLVPFKKVGGRETLAGDFSNSNDKQEKRSA